MTLSHSTRTYDHDLGAAAPCDCNFFGFDFGENRNVVGDGYSIRTNRVGLDDLAIPTSFVPKRHQKISTASSGKEGAKGKK
jgi:hypothetical protein